jgi:hypothetical protein
MSKITLVSPASGTAEFSITTPSGTSTDRTLTLPDAGGTVVSDTATQTLTNKTIQGGALTLATAVASTSGTSIDFTSIPSWVKRITVMFSGVSTNGTSNILVQLGDAGGIENTGYVSSANYSTSTADSTAGFVILYAIATATNTHGGAITLSNVTGANWVSSGNMTDSAGRNSSSAGFKTLSDTLTQVRITTVNGTDTFDAGTINIMYEG